MATPGWQKGLTQAPAWHRSPGLGQGSGAKVMQSGWQTRMSWPSQSVVSPGVQVHAAVELLASEVPVVPEVSEVPVVPVVPEVSGSVVAEVSVAAVVEGSVVVGEEVPSVLVPPEVRVVALLVLAAVSVVEVEPGVVVVASEAVGGPAVSSPQAERRARVRPVRSEARVITEASRRGGAAGKRGARNRLARARPAASLVRVMPRLTHESLVQLIRHAPDLIPGLLWPTEGAAGTVVVHVGAAEFVDLNFAEYRADAVLLRGGTPERPARVLVVEVQGEPDARKRRSWILYVAGLHVRFESPVILVVLALDPEVAAWCAEPIDLGEGRCVLRPWVLGPDAIPIITDPEVARRAPELAVLSVAAHAAEPVAPQIALAALAAVQPLDDERGIIYPDFILGLLPQLARIALEKLMRPANYEFQSDFARKYFSEGKAEGEVAGKADLLLKLLQLKGLAPTPELRARVLACTDEATLERWAGRVLVASGLDEVFADA